VRNKLQVASIIFSAFAVVIAGCKTENPTRKETANLAQSQSPADLNNRNVERRAVEAVIWAMPVVNYDLMLQEMLTKTDGKVNQVIYWGRPLDSKNQTLTPNPDALYFMSFFNTKDGPIVLELPPATNDGSFNGNIVTIWQMPLEDAGLLGVTKVKAASSLSCLRVTRASRPQATFRCSLILLATIFSSVPTSRATATATFRNPSTTGNS
jgi:hypothetical protein